MWRFLDDQGGETGDGSTVAEAIAAAIIPGVETIREGDESTVQAARELFTSRLGKMGPAAFEAMVHAVEWAAWARRGRRFSRMTADEQHRELRRWAENEWTRWPFLLFSGVVKGAHFDNPEHFRSFDVPYDRSSTPQSQRWTGQIQGPEDIEDGETITCDVVVVGTGAGGAVVGAKLAAEGYAVAFVEEGMFHGREDFDGRAIGAHEQFYRHGTVALGNSVIPVQMGKMVGGSTAVNAGTCFRPPDSVLRRWCHRLGTEELSPEKLAPHFRRVERAINVHAPPESALGGAAELFFDGCEQNGFSHGPVPRNVDGCTGEGVCEFGCPEQARNSTDVSYIPRALDRGAVVFCGTRADKVRFRGGDAAGVEAKTVDGRRLNIDAQATIVAGGAVPTPALLLNQGIGNSSGRVGRNLSLHPAGGAAALFDESVRGFDAVPQSYYCDEFLDSDGLLIAGAQLPVDVGPALLPVVGEELSVAAANMDGLVGSTIITGDDHRPGRVRSLGAGRPVITYRMTRRNVDRLHHGMVRLAEVYFAAGARKVYPLMPRMPVLESPDDIEKLCSMQVQASDFITTSWHPLGTCQMGTDPSTSVVDMNHESHDVDGLFIVDGSTLPGPTGVNPQLTIMAMADRAADRIIDRLQEGN